MSRQTQRLFEPALVRRALPDAFRKLSPVVQWQNPVMFIVWCGSLLTTLLAAGMFSGRGGEGDWMSLLSRGELL